MQWRSVAQDSPQGLASPHPVMKSMENYKEPIQAGLLMVQPSEAKVRVIPPGKKHHQLRCLLGTK